jgi:hypothetical protein
MNETTTPARYLFAGGKSVITADGTRATYLELLGRKPRTTTVENTPEWRADNDPAYFEETVSEHFEWCDECDSSKDAYWHEMDVREDPSTAYTLLEPPC